MRIYRPESEPKYPIGACVSDECWVAIVRWQKDHYGTALDLPPPPLPELEDIETIGKLMAQAPESEEHLRA